MSNMHLVTGYAGTPHVSAADFGAFWAAIIGNGDYVFDHGQKFAATIVSNNQIRIADGDLLMQGRHARIKNGETIDLSIENGTAGMQRSDLIVARYTKSEETGIENTNLVVILGTPVASSPVDPEYTTGNIFNGDLQRDFPLFRVNLNGTTISSVDTLFAVTPGMLSNIEAFFDSFEEKIETQIENIESKVDTEKTIIGTYTGTGTYGNTQKNTLTFPFKPKAVFVQMEEANTDLESVPMFYCLYGNKHTQLTSGYVLYTSWGANSVSWYNTSGAGQQLNATSRKYTYIAIG